MSNFIHLQTKSHYSISCGLPKTNQIIDKALELGMKAVALTDKNTFFGLVKFYNYALEKGIKPICGVDFDVRVNDGYTNLILLAKNKKGLESLFKLSTESFINSGLDKKSIPEQDILNYAEHLVCIIPASSMNLRNLALKKEESLIVNLYTKYQKAFAKNLFVGVSNVSELGYDSASALACNLAKENNIPTVAINDVLFLEKEDHLAHQAKVAINLSLIHI